MEIFITIKISCFYLCFSLICICYQQPRCLKISTFSYIYFSFFWCMVSFLYINLICDFGCIYGQANFCCYNCHIFIVSTVCPTASPKTTTSSARRSYCLFSTGNWSSWVCLYIRYTFLHTYVIQEFWQCITLPQSHNHLETKWHLSLAFSLRF